MSEWISVKDKKPPLWENVLLFIEDDETCHVGFKLKSNDYYIVGGWENCHYCGGESNIYLIDEVPDHLKNSGYIKIATHWMSLPRPPNE